MERISTIYSKKTLVRNILFFVSLCCIFLCATVAYADTTGDIPYIQTVYSTNNGLLSGEANDIVQTDDGILWVGTYAGLYRYNGSVFHRMDHFNNVRNANCLFADQQGLLWVGTNDAGVAICKDEEIIGRITAETDGLPSDSVRSIVQSDHLYYLGTSDSLAILEFSDGEKKSELRCIPQIKYAAVGTADKKGNVVVITLDGTMFLLQGEKIIARSTCELQQEIYTTCTFGTNGMLYVGTSGNNVYEMAIEEGQFIIKRSFSTQNLNNMNVIKFIGARMYVCADNGVGYFDIGWNFEQVQTENFDNSIDQIIEDYQGNLWLASSRKGLLRLCPSDFENLYKQYGLPGTVVNTTERWNGLLYVGTDTGLDILDESTGTVIRDSLSDALQGIRIRCIKIDTANHLWICTYGKGLMEVLPEGEIHFYNRQTGAFGDRVRVVLELSDYSIVAAGDTGITFIRDSAIQSTLGYGTDIGSAMVLCLTELRDGTVLAGTDGDGIIVIRHETVERSITAKDGLISGIILRLVPDPAGDGVFVVTSNGICYMDAEYQTTSIDRLPYYNNFDIISSNGQNLYILSSAGLFVVNRDKLLEGSAATEYVLYDGRNGLTENLTANAWNYMDEKGHLYLSTAEGVFRFSMMKTADIGNAYKILLRSVKVDDDVYLHSDTGKFVIDRDVQKVELNPEVLNFSTSNPMIQYYLEGFDNNPSKLAWSKLSTVSYTNLPPGTYTFHISVLDNKTGQILQQERYRIEKEKSIWDYIWFRNVIVLLGLVAVAGITWGMARYRSHKEIVKRERELAWAKEQLEMGNQTIEAIARTVDAKDGHTSQHSARVSFYSGKIAEKLGMSKSECDNIRRAALLHDIGKIGISDSILNKPGALTKEEYNRMKEHVKIGAEILKDFTLIAHVQEGTLYHHERYDGTGYVYGLKGEEIPLYGRIICVADAFDAMTANRVYRDKLPISVVLSELQQGKGTQFDPQLVDILLNMIEEKEIDVQGLYEE